MADERNPLPMDVPDFVREAEEAMARGETFGQPLAKVTIKFGKGLVGEPFTSKSGKELMSRDELAVMDGSKCVLQLRGVRPFLSDKYDLTQHPNYKYTADYDKKLTFDIEKYLSTRAKLHLKDEFFVMEEEN